MTWMNWMTAVPLKSGFLPGHRTSRSSSCLFTNHPEKKPIMNLMLSEGATAFIKGAQELELLKTYDFNNCPCRPRLATVLFKAKNKRSISRLTVFLCFLFKFYKELAAFFEDDLVFVQAGEGQGVMQVLQGGIHGPLLGQVVQGQLVKDPGQEVDHVVA